MILYDKEKPMAIIDSVRDLSIEQAIDLKKNGIKKIQIVAKAYSNYGSNPGNDQQKPYDIDTYIAVRMKLNELVEDIDMQMDDENKFAIIYSRICRSIVYDFPAAYPKGEKEKIYARQNEYKCRNLINGLLEGKCVCAGYADILRCALELVGIEACLVSGKIVEEPKIPKKIIAIYDSLKSSSSIKKFFSKPIDKFRNPKTEYHAWVKVKINGNWYNSDPTWDANNIRNGLEPQYALESDEECKRSNKLNIPGPKAITEFPKEKINQLFEHNNFDIKRPNMKDFKRYIKCFGLQLHSAFINDILRPANGLIESMKALFKKKMLLLREGVSYNRTEISRQLKLDCGYSWDELLSIGFFETELERLVERFYHLETATRIADVESIRTCMNTNISTKRTFEVECGYPIRKLLEMGLTQSDIQSLEWNFDREGNKLKGRRERLGELMEQKGLATTNGQTVNSKRIKSI